MATRLKAPFLAFLLFILLIASLTLNRYTFAEVVKDGSLGGGIVSVGPGVLPDGRTTNYLITDSLGKKAGQNLFHSFSSFNVGTGESATFTGPGDIRNVVSRVTGGTYSWIDGALRSTIQGANLYFLNPWGVVFGPNASLDIKGSFHVSTADYLRFEDGLRFYSAPGTSNQVLSTASPVAFGFLNSNPAGISIQGSSLKVPPGETLSVVGGHIDIIYSIIGSSIIPSYLGAPGGRIHLASMASPGEVIPSPAGEVPDLQVQPLKASGSLSVDGTILDVRDVSGARAGTVLIRGGRLVLDHASGIAADNHGDAPGYNPAIGITAEEVTLDNESWMSAAVFGAGHGGNIEIDASKLTLLNGSFVGALPWWGSTGIGGDINIAAANLEISGGSSISSDNRGSSHGGRLTIEVTDSVLLSSLYSSISSASWASGDAGSIHISAPVLIIKDEASICGDSFSDGRGGDIDVVAERLSLIGGGSISSNTYGGAGNGGNLSITATESISINARGEPGLTSALLNRTTGTGDAGLIQISTPVLEIGENGSIGAETLGTGRAGDIDVAAGRVDLTAGGRVSNSAYGTTGKGGDISIRASDSITISGTDSQGNPSGLISYAAAAGDAGNILLSASNVVLRDEASIGADTVGDGRAGSIELTVQRLTLSGGATISSGSDAGSGRGGDILVTAMEEVTLSGPGYIATGTAGAGDGGNITISSNALTLQDHAAVYADTIGSGLGGNVGINVTSLTMREGSRISSNTLGGTGDGATVIIEAKDGISLSGKTTGFYSISSGDGKGGNIEVGARKLELKDGAMISTQSKGAGNAGNIRITVQESFLSRNSKISTEARNADGGNITITAPYMVHLKESEVTASVGGGAGTVGGNVSIDPQFVILDHSKIIANAFEGRGGNIRIVAGVFLSDPYSVVDASSALGIDGSVDIRAPITEISGTLVPLGEDFISAFELLREPCMARIRGGKYSSFIVSGRDGLPMEPGRLLPSPMP